MSDSNFEWTKSLARGIELIEGIRARRGGHERCSFDFAVQVLMRRAENITVREYLRGQRLSGPTPRARPKR